jgi:hypothetical protein
VVSRSGGIAGLMSGEASSVFGEPGVFGSGKSCGKPTGDSAGGRISVGSGSGIGDGGGSVGGASVGGSQRA